MDCDESCCRFAEPPEAHRSLFVREACFGEGDDQRPLTSLDLWISAPLDDDPSQVLRVRAWEFNKTYFSKEPSEVSKEQMRQVLGPAGEIELISPGAYLVEDIPDPGPAIYHRFTDPDHFLDCMWDIEECDAPEDVLDFLIPRVTDRSRVYSGTTVERCDERCCSFMPNQNNKYGNFLKHMCFDQGEHDDRPYVQRVVMGSEPN